jgi:hypothetical protein
MLHLNVFHSFDIAEDPEMKLARSHITEDDADLLQTVMLWVLCS